MPHVYNVQGGGEAVHAYVLNIEVQTRSGSDWSCMQTDPLQSVYLIRFETDYQLCLRYGIETRLG